MAELLHCAVRLKLRRSELSSKNVVEVFRGVFALGELSFVLSTSVISINKMTQHWEQSFGNLADYFQRDVVSNLNLTHC